ncbi:unnamed protein product [Orchesella dallaii]|uniref:Uncharacterized protein n=1 Tax=Orchesella dallaii TaxID=48710 RepID=A0ABP1Q104_9HEXA
MDREGIETDDRVLEEAEEMVLNQKEDEEKIQVETEPITVAKSVEKYDETELPPSHEFYNDLTEKPIEPEEYLHAQRVWRELGIKNLR